MLGGARSGKSRFAQELAAASGCEVTFVATASPGDEEMARRIEAHRRVRPAEWCTVEAEFDAARAISRAKSGSAVLLDCLSLLVSNLLLRDENAADDEVENQLLAEVGAIFDASERLELLVVVSNETGQGVVPPTPLGRRYRDVLGTANQRAAGRSGTVYLMVAGIPVKIKP